MLKYASGISTVPRVDPRGGPTGFSKQGQDLAHDTPMTGGAGRLPREYPQDLISLLDALSVGRAARLHPGHEDAHVIAPGQPQPDALALEEADHPRVGAVPARGGRGGVRPEWADRGEGSALSLGNPHPLQASVSPKSPINCPTQHKGYKQAGLR